VCAMAACERARQGRDEMRGQRFRELACDQEREARRIYKNSSEHPRDDEPAKARHDSKPVMMETNAWYRYGRCGSVKRTHALEVLVHLALGSVFEHQIHAVGVVEISKEAQNVAVADD
jgi:hypothetical protein